MYPKIEIKLNNIIKNAKDVKKMCAEHNVSLSLVTKLLADNKQIVKELVDAGIEIICDSRIQNFISYKDIDVEKWLIRIPMISEAADVVRYTDASLNSEIEVIKQLNIEAEKQGKKHKIILMYELGDLREGCLKEDLEEVLRESLMLKNIEVYGIGVNLSCYGEIVPTCTNMLEFSNLVEELEEKYNIKFKVVSGGNSSSYNMLKNGELPSNINNLRIGESIYLGNIPCFEEPIEELNRDNFILKAEIIELKEKPSLPWGEAGKNNSFGEHNNFEDNGIRKRAIIALGKQDVRIECIYPKDKKVHLLDGSSDHIILDVTDSEREYKVGDIIEFETTYAGVLTLNTSKYVERSIV